MLITTGGDFLKGGGFSFSFFWLGCSAAHQTAEEEGANLARFVVARFAPVEHISGSAREGYPTYLTDRQGRKEGKKER